MIVNVMAVNVITLSMTEVNIITLMAMMVNVGGHGS